MARPKTLTAIGNRAPTRELGAVLNGAFLPSSMAPWTTFVDDQEYVPELQWPRSVGEYRRMRTDSQVAALYYATTLALMKFQWFLDPNGAEDAMVNKLSSDYNLPVLGEKVNQRKRQRYKRRFTFKRHLRKALYAGIYGHYYFEQVGTVEDDGFWHLRKLAERPPWTIQDFRVAEDGGLVSLIQNVSKNYGRGVGELPELPVDRLVGYVNEQEGANWVGRSWFRDIYKNFLIKDRLIRIDAINHERAGGVPYIEAHPGATLPEIEALNKMASNFRIGDTSGGAVPSGAKLLIAKGTNSSVVESMRYHDEAMARKFMLMVIQLGQTKTGSRALGTTFVDFWGGGLEAIAEELVADTFNEHVIEDDVDWNWGEDVEQVPLLVYQFDPELAVDQLVQLIKVGAIVMDDDLEHELRKEMGLPDKGTPRPNPVLMPTPVSTSTSDPASKGAPAKKAQAGTGGEVEGAPSRPTPPVHANREEE